MNKNEIFAVVSMSSKACGPALEIERSRTFSRQKNLNATGHEV